MMKKMSAKRRRAFRLARQMMVRFSIGYIAKGSVPSDFGWELASVEEVANFIELFNGKEKRCKL